MQRLQLSDLLQAAQPSSPKSTIKSPQGPKPLKSQPLLDPSSHLIKQLPLRQQLRIKRESTYRTTQQEMDKWVGIVKLNREKDTLNLVKKDKDNAANVNYFKTTPMNEFHSKIEKQLKEMEIPSEKAVMKREEETLAKLSKEEAQERLREARRLKNIHFNQEIKRRRMAKIKSKLYRKIKKRQKLRQQSKRVGELQGDDRKQYMEKLAKQRVYERITLRHRSKNKHIQNLLRFSKNNKDTIQNTLNEVNAIRQQQLEKVNEEFRERMSQDLQGENLEDDLDELQREVDQMEEEEEVKEKKGLDSMKFMKIGKQREMQREREEARQIAKMANEIESQSQHSQEQGTLTRKMLGQGTSKATKTVPNSSINYIQRNLKQALMADQNLTEGINVSKLKQKYQPQRTDLDLTQAIKLHKGVFEGNEALDENYRDFEKEKYQDYEAEMPADKKPLKGWGGWAGPGISQPKVDHAAQVKKKIAKIEQIKRRRRDGQMAGVIVRQTYNKDLKDYFVNKLPHNMKSAQQFDYLQGESIGPQWNTLTQFRANVQPKVATKAGQVIEPIKLPRHLQKNKK